MEYGAQKAAKRIEKEAEDSLLSRFGKVGLSGLVSGGILGGVAGVMNARTIPAVLKSMAIGGGLGGVTAGGANVIGSAVMPSDDEDPTVNTRRGAVGGAVVGSGLGAAGGYAATSPVASDAYRRILSVLPESSTVAGRAVNALRRLPQARAIGLGAGALVGGIAGGYQGADEGMQYDVLMNEMRRREASGA